MKTNVALQIVSTMFFLKSIISCWAGEPFPANALNFLNIADSRTNWWVSNYKQLDTKASHSCPILTVFEGNIQYTAPCQRVLTENQVFKDEEQSVLASLDKERASEYRSIRTSLFDQPFPFTPIFMAPQLIDSPTANLRPLRAGSAWIQGDKEETYPVSELIRVSKQTPFDQSTERVLAFSFWLPRQWGLNLSFENININPALMAGYEYWSLAADKEATACPPKNQIGQHPSCFIVVRVVSAKTPFEPQHFSRGIAMCTVFSKEKRNFPYNCSLMVFETTDKRIYIKAMVGSPMMMGGGAFADDYGAFTLSCNWPDNIRIAKFKQIKSALGLEGYFKLQHPTDIEAETGFRRFDAVSKYGRVKLIVSELPGDPHTQAELLMYYRVFGPSDTVLFKFWGRWWNQNRDERAMPDFEDNDAIEFKKKIFDRAVGDSECNITPRTTRPSISQR